MRTGLFFGTAAIAALGFATPSFADDLPPVAAEAQKPTGTVPASTAPPPPEPKPAKDAGKEHIDDVRFRGGISAGGGGLFLGGYTFGLGGVDGRLGVQINDLVGIYAQPQLAIYGGSVSIGSGRSLPGVGGIVGGSALVDFTFIDHVFVGVGGGGALLNNPAAGELHFRVGGYPAVGFSRNKIQRKGLMIGADLRVFFVQGGLTLFSPTASIGYEAF